MQITINRVGSRWSISCGDYFSGPLRMEEATDRLYELQEEIERYEMHGWSTNAPADIERLCRSALRLWTYEELVRRIVIYDYWTQLVHPQDIAGLLTYQPNAPLYDKFGTFDIDFATGTAIRESCNGSLS